MSEVQVCIYYKCMPAIVLVRVKKHSVLEE